MAEGWISLHRKIQDSWLWEEKPFDKRSAWLDILMSANHETKKFPLGNEIVTVERGSFITSELKLMERWGWSKSKVRGFLKMLQDDEMLIKKTDRKKTTLTVVNYSVYQDSENHKKTAKEPQKNHEETTKRPQKDTNNNDNNVNNENNENKVVVVEKNKKEKKAKNPAADIPNELNNLPCDRDLPPIENNIPKAFEFYEENFVKPNGKVQAPQAIANDLIQAIEAMGDDLVLLALQKTLEKDATWRYTKTILDNWKKTGITTLEQALNEKKPPGKKGAKGNGDNRQDSSREFEQQLEQQGLLFRV